MRYSKSSQPGPTRQLPHFWTNTKYSQYSLGYINHILWNWLSGYPQICRVCFVPNYITILSLWYLPVALSENWVPPNMKVHDFPYWKSSFCGITIFSGTHTHAHTHIHIETIMGIPHFQSTPGCMMNVCLVDHPRKSVVKTSYNPLQAMIDLFYHSSLR